MKKYILSLAAAVCLSGTFTAVADNETSTNRMIVVNGNGSYKGFNVGTIDHVEFASVEGEVAANVKVLEFDLEKALLEVKRTPECFSFKVNVIPGVVAHQLEANPLSAESWLDRYGSPEYAEDFTKGTLSGITLDYGTEYAAVTLGYDMYGVACEFRADYFTTESAPVVGNPMVDVKVVNADYTTLELDFIPNEDVSSFYFVIFGEGEAESQYNMFAPMFGFKNMGEMIQMWGLEHVGNYSHTYKDLEPNTVQELYVLPLDANGNHAPLQVFKMSTKAKGGPGDAVVDIKIDSFSLTDWDGEMKPTLAISFTPNDQTWAYRIGVYPAETYDSNEAEILAELKSDPWMPTSGWWQFFDLSSEYMIDPETAVVIVAVAKNGEGVWGEPSIMRYTTPALEGVATKAAAPRNGEFKKRKNPVRNIHRAGFAPSVSERTVRMTGK